LSTITIEIQHSTLTDAELSIQDQIYPAERQGNVFSWSVELGHRVEIRFRPWKIDPLLRINGFLINKWLADVLVMDHALQFDLPADFFFRYRDKDLQGRLNSIGDNPNPITIDRVIGRNLHEDMVEKIKTRLREKRNIS
jgi:hypothetical protein